MKHLLSLSLSLALLGSAQAADTFVSFQSQPGATCLYPTHTGGVAIWVDGNDYPGILRANRNLANDINQVVGKQVATVQQGSSLGQLSAGTVVVGSLQQSALIKQLIKKKLIDPKQLQGKREKYVITLVDASVLTPGTAGQVLVIAGADKRGTEYGIYELSRQMGVSPWAWWADMPVEQHDSLFLKPGLYTDGEPVVEYRGLFLNDEAPCLSGWVREKFPDSKCENLPVDPHGNTYARGFNHLFYEHVFELLLRLKGNYLWPAMWGNAFYADDPLNGPLADEMGIIMGTSHHEPMARNHQEWVRMKNATMQRAGVSNPDEAPAEARWDYAVNQPIIDQFFREGIERARGTEDLITIGMRGDGDTGLGGKEGHDDEAVNMDEYNKKLMERILGNQRKIIEKVTGKKAEKTPQMWALYKEVQHLYDIGLDVPEDVLIMVCDDNWGDIRNVPESNVSALRTREKLLNRKGGWGMYYHVDYVGAPRNTKWANVTNPHHLWEQMRLTYEYGIDRLWILNVGDLKPMEQPIDLFLKMAWRPDDYKEVSSVASHMQQFCTDMLGKSAPAADVAEVSRLMTTYLQYNSRSTAELLTHRTYNLQSGEWEQVKNQYKSLEADALRFWLRLKDTPAADAYHQLVLYPIQSMANLYEMYYAQAQNLYLASVSDVDANRYADLVEQCFARDAELTADYHSIGGGKWNHLMDQTHIGYRSWQQPNEQVCPMVKRVETLGTVVEPNTFLTNRSVAKFNVFLPYNDVVAIEAEHFASAADSQDGHWTVIPTLGRTKSAVALLPHNASCQGAELAYQFQAPANFKGDSVKVHIVTNSTLPFLRKDGHRYTLSIDGADAKEVNYNERYAEDRDVWKMYDIAASRIIETVVTLPINTAGVNLHSLDIAPLDPGLVLEKVVIDFGGYAPSYLFGNENPRVVTKRE